MRFAINIYISSLFSLNSKYTFFFFGMNPSFNSMAWFQAFCTSICSDSFFSNIFFYFYNFLGTNFLNASESFSSFVFFISFLSIFCFLFPYMGGHLVILTSPFSQLISGLWAANYGIPNITSVLPRLQKSILVLFICSLKNILHSIWCIMAPSTFIILSTFFTRRGFFNFSILNPFFLAKVVFMNRPVTLLSSNAFTATPSWFSSFSNPTFI